MPKLDVATIKSRSIRGFLVLTVIQIINLLSVFLLTIFIDPRTFGVFIVVSASLAFLTYFSDIGLAAALIQKKDKVTKEDLTTTFTIQQILVILVIAIAFLLSSHVGRFYELDRPGLWLFQALLFAFFLSSLKTIPSVLLERNLQFQKLAIPQVAETFAFNIVAVSLAVNGFGITSFTFAVLARGVVGLVAIYLVSPWRVSLGISKSSAKKLLSFGIPFQANSFLALLKDDLLIIILAKVLTLTQVGFIGFAQKWALAPLRLIMDKLIRVTFPSFSRLQEDATNLKLAIEKTIFSISFFTMPSILGIVVLSPYAIRIIPKYTQWEEALPSLTFFAINALLSAISTPLTNMLNAIGKIRVTLRLMIFWTIATWLLTFTLITFIGFIGVSLAHAIVATSVVIVVHLARKYVAFEIYKPISRPLFSAIVMGIVLYFASPFFLRDVPTLILAVFMGGVIYMGTIFLIAYREVTTDIKSILKYLQSPKP